MAPWCVRSQTDRSRPSVPFVCIVWHCTIALRANHAEPVTSWRFHHPPRFYFLDSLRPKFLQARHFGLDVVGFDIQVNAACMGYLLQQDDQLFVTAADPN